MRSVVIKLKEVRDISPLAVVAIDYNNNEEVLPKSYILHHRDNIYYIAEWLARRTSLVYSRKRVHVNFKKRHVKNRVVVTEHIPKKISIDGKDRNLKDLER